MLDDRAPAQAAVGSSEAAMWLRWMCRLKLSHAWGPASEGAPE